MRGRAASMEASRNPVGDAGVREKRNPPERNTHIGIFVLSVCFMCFLRTLEY